MGNHTNYGVYNMVDVKWIIANANYEMIMCLIIAVIIVMMIANKILFTLRMVRCIIMITTTMMITIMMEDNDNDVNGYVHIQ
jgi:hypothetical protein